MEPDWRLFMFKGPGGLVSGVLFMVVVGKHLAFLLLVVWCLKSNHSTAKI